MQLSILLFLQRIHAPFLDMAAEAASFTGEIILPLVLLCLIHWCISKKKSFAIAVPLLSAQYISQVLKAIIRYPRPFQVHPDLIEPGRLSTATGYSFPSGHSTLSGVFYSSLAVAGWKRWLTALCLIPIVLVPLSRLYLGVHWPADVAAGTAIGLAAGLILTPLLLRLYDRRRPFLVFTFIYAIISLAASAVMAAMLCLGRADPVAFSDLLANSSISSGVMLGFYLDRKTLMYIAEEGSLPRKMLRGLLGIAGLIAIVLVLSSAGLPKPIETFIAYSAAGLWITYLYPLIAVGTGLMAKESTKI